MSSALPLSPFFSLTIPFPSCSVRLCVKVFAPWGEGDLEPGVIKTLFLNGQATIAWSDGTTASKVSQATIDATRPDAAKGAHAKVMEENVQDEKEHEEKK